jgi:hypothetical protein
MSGGWVAGSVRARAMVRRCIGAGAARKLAASGSLEEALQALAATPYGRERLPGLTLSAAQHEVAGTILWDLRVLAGWLPGDGVRLLRALAGWFELANVEEMLQATAGRPADAEFSLGALATAWPRLRQASSPVGLRAVLAASAWGDPGGETAEAVLQGMRSRWAARVAAAGEPARSWAAGAEALLLAGQRFTADREARDTGPAPSPGHPRGVRGDGSLRPGGSGPAAGGGKASRVVPPRPAEPPSAPGPAAAGVTALDELSRWLPVRARWVLARISSPGDLWLGEAAWWARVERDGFRLLRTSGLDSGPVLGAVAVMAADAWRVRAALEIAARGGGPLEAYDAVA